MTFGLYDIFWSIFNMMSTRGSGLGVGGPERPGFSDDDIREFIATEVAPAFRGAIAEVFASIKTVMIELF